MADKFKIKIFLSGGITGLDAEESKKWREYIQRYFALYRHDNIIINPVNHFNPNEETSESIEREGMEFCLSHLRTSDLIIVNLNKLDSIGTAQELMLAHELHIPIIGIVNESLVDNVHPWIKMEVSKMFTYTDDIDGVLNDVIWYALRHYIDL